MPSRYDITQRQERTVDLRLKLGRDPGIEVNFASRAFSFDHLVGTGEQRRRDFKA
jgi:hypothetical protein